MLRCDNKMVITRCEGNASNLWQDGCEPTSGLCRGHVSCVCDRDHMIHIRDRDLETRRSFDIYDLACM